MVCKHYLVVEEPLRLFTAFDNKKVLIKLLGYIMVRPNR